MDAWLIIVPFVAISLLLIWTAADYVDAYRDPADHMHEPMQWADVTCRSCGQGCAAQAPTLTEAYRMAESWLREHATRCEGTRS